MCVFVCVYIPICMYVYSSGRVPSPRTNVPQPTPLDPDRSQTIRTQGCHEEAALAQLSDPAAVAIRARADAAIKQVPVRPSVVRSGRPPPAVAPPLRGASRPSPAAPWARSRRGCLSLAFPTKCGCKVAMQPRCASVGQVSRQVEADLQEVVPRANGGAHTHIARKHKRTQTH